MKTSCYASIVFFYLVQNVYRDTYRIVTPVSRYVSYREVTVSFHPYINPHYTIACGVKDRTPPAWWHAWPGQNRTPKSWVEKGVVTLKVGVVDIKSTGDAACSCSLQHNYAHILHCWCSDSGPPNKLTTLIIWTTVLGLPFHPSMPTKSYTLLLPLLCRFYSLFSTARPGSPFCTVMWLVPLIAIAK